MKKLRPVLVPGAILTAALCLPACGPEQKKVSVADKAPAPAKPTTQAPAPSPATPAPAPAPAPVAPKVDQSGAGVSAPAGTPAKVAAPADGATRLSVEECVEIALRRNIELRRTILSDRQSELDRSSAIAQFLPTFGASAYREHDQVSEAGDTTKDTLSGSITEKTPIGTTVTARASQSRERTAGVSDRDYDSSASLEVRQPLLSGGGTAAAFYDYRSADLGRKASAGDLERTAQSTVASVRKLYWVALQSELAVAANRRSLDSADYFLKSAKAREEAGQASKLDVSNAEIQRSTREVNLTLAEARLQSSLDDLKQALDLPIGERVALASSAGYVPAVREADRLMAEALKRRPDLSAARERVEVLRLDVDRKRRNAWPTLDAVAGYTVTGSGASSDESQTASDRTARVGVELSVPLGLVAARNAKEKAELELRRGELDLHRREVEVQSDLRSVLRDLDAAERNVASYEKRLEAAKLAAAAAKALYERGKASSFDVVRAEDDLLSAELGLNSSRADCLSRQADLDLTSGRPVKELLPTIRTGAAAPAGTGNNGKK